jgi:hypothetical protein
MREIMKYKKIQGSKRQRERLAAINKLQDDIAKCYYSKKFKNKN